MSVDGRRRYNSGARCYDLLSFEKPVYRAGRAMAIDLLDLRPGDRVLDVGCGTGLNFPLLLEAIGSEGQLTGVDASVEMLREAENRTARHRWDNVTLRKVDAALIGSSFDERQARFDAAIFTYSLSIIGEWRSAWQQTLALVRPGGTIAIVDTALPTGWGRVLSPLARLACFSGGVDRSRRPWTLVAQDTEESVHRTLRQGHIHVAVGRLPTSSR